MIKFKLDIKSKRLGIAGRLSNFTRRDFYFDGVLCRSIEGVLQGFKRESEGEQRIICGLWGSQAKLAGGDDWKSTQTLFWRGVAYKRESPEYRALLERLYRTVYDQDERFRKDIERSKRYVLTHSIGSHDPRDSVLTEEEFLSLLLALQ